MLEVILLTLTLFLCGAYFGLTLFCQIGLLPAMRRVSPQTFRESWVAIDSLMDRAMPPFKIILLLVNLALTGLCFLDHHRQLALYSGFSFLLSLIALILTVVAQLPVNKQIAAAKDDGQLHLLLQKTNTNFTVRFVLALIAFAALCIGATHYPLHAYRSFPLTSSGNLSSPTSSNP